MLQDDWWMLGLAAELGLDRLHGQAVGLHAAVAAALADPLVDHDAHRAARRPRPRLRSRRFSAAHCWSWMSTVTPVDLAQRLLRLDDPVAVPDLDARPAA